jgi:predicted O-linked N-acetylglucosamine transferase (SPINDLY family)
LSAIDYRIVDAVTDPPGDAGCEASETLLRLPRGFICFNGPENAPAVATPPYLANGFVTFGSFNNPAKLSEATCEVWSRLLLQLPGARLLLKGKAFADPETRDGFLSRFVSRDVDSARVELIAWTPDTASHLALYDRIDIALDPFPYNGTTTTCEALWMGVPVAALRGDRHSARVGASLLTQAGLKDWIGDSVSDYIAIASRLASDPQRLRDLRQSLRPQLAASDLCNGLSFARDFESALRDIWRRRCELPQPL